MILTEEDRIQRQLGTAITYLVVARELFDLAMVLQRAGVDRGLVSTVRRQGVKYMGLFCEIRRMLGKDFNP